MRILNLKKERKRLQKGSKINYFKEAAFDIVNPIVTMDKKLILVDMCSVLYQYYSKSVQVENSFSIICVRIKTYS